jgi:hypothetical protein
MPYARRRALLLVALVALGGCGGDADEQPPGALPPPPTGIEVVNRSREDVLMRWHSKSVGGGGSAVVSACSDRPVWMEAGSYRVIFTPTSRGEENIDFEVGERVECCVLISRTGVFSVERRRPPPFRC